MVHKLLQTPHIPWDWGFIELAPILLNRVIGQVNELVVDIVQVVILC